MENEVEESVSESGNLVCLEVIVVFWRLSRGNKRAEDRKANHL